jgi:hypothetical protein
MVFITQGSFGIVKGRRRWVRTRGEVPDGTGTRTCGRSAGLSRERANGWATGQPGRRVIRPIGADIRIVRLAPIAAKPPCMSAGGSRKGPAAASFQLAMARCLARSIGPRAAGCTAGGPRSIRPARARATAARAQTGDGDGPGIDHRSVGAAQDAAVARAASATPSRVPPSPMDRATKRVALRGAGTWPASQMG